MVKDNIFFVVRSHAAPGYSKPTFSSSKITEVVFGEFVKVLSKKGSWLKVLQNDGYKSWIKNFYGSFENEDKYFQHMVIDRHPLPFGSRLKIIDNNFYTINGDIYNYENQPLKIGSLRDINELIVYAKSLIGCPYRWGGKTSGGFDCSGFVQTLFLLTGMLLPRDSWQQSEKFNHAIIDGKVSKPGDLHFFGKDGKISHVGISTGGYNLIHCQGWVKEESFEDIDSANKKLADMYMHTCSVELNSTR